MFYIMSYERDDWGEITQVRRGPMYKNIKSACRFALKFSNAMVYKYGKKVPYFSSNPKLRGLLNDYWETNTVS